MIKDRSIDIKQNSSDRNKVIEEFNKLFEDFKRENVVMFKISDHFELMSN